jgi:hypothetical protein
MEESVTVNLTQLVEAATREANFEQLARALEAG